MTRKSKIIILCIIIAITMLSTMYMLSVNVEGVRDTQSISVVQSIDNTVASENILDGNKVLYISSYSPSFETFNHQINGIESVLGDNSFDIEFMDSKRLFTEDDKNNFYNNLKYKIQRLGDYDAIITADDNALKFALKYQEELFSETPIVFLGVNDIELALDASANPYITGIVEAASITETIQIAYNVNPWAENVVALVDSTISGQGDLKVFLDDNKKVSGLNYEVIDLSHLTFDQFENEISSLDKNDIVILLSVYRDANGISVSFEEGLSIILDNCSQPIYHPYLHGIGSGVLGGKVICHYEQGSSAAAIIHRCLNGEVIKDIPCVTTSTNEVIFDYNKIKEHSISTKALPSETIFINSDSIQTEILKKSIFGLTLILLQLCIIIALGININKKNKAETEYLKYKLIADKALNGHLITDENNNIVYCNQYFASIHGYSIEETLGKNREIFHTNEQWNECKKISDNLLSAGYSTLIEAEHVKKDGTKFPVYISGIVFYDEDESKQYLVFNVIDSSEIKTLQKDKLALEKALGEEQRLKAIGTLASGVAHEINNPITGVINYAQIIEDEYSPETNANTLAKEIKTEANRIAKIIKNLLNYARRETDGTGYSVVHINDVINDTHSLIKTIIKKDNIKINIDIDDKLPNIYCRSQEIQQIIINLVVNAKDSLNNKYNENSNNKIINLKCYSHLIQNKQYLRLMIEDFGTGIDDQIITQIFDPFFTTKSRGQGTGLGLSLSYKIAKEHGGNLSAESIVDSYTRFYLDLPIYNK